MNIITNNCLGGFIYRDILRSNSENPFIWTGFDIDVFSTFLDNFNKIDFNNVKIIREGDGLSNNFFTIIDDRYKVRNCHVHFDMNCDKPTQKGNGIYYNKPWEYILDQYNKRIDKMGNDLRVGVYDKDESNLGAFNELCAICKKHNYRTLIFTDKPINQNFDNIKICYFKHKDPWFTDLRNNFNNEFEWFLR